ncbi:MAG: gamma-glutamylcyclotransferase family protein [Reyranella sp.]|uniref:gamma-glutamylcyclotransferase family protein n=1 Tax=Reyranella sp. TaxID=1929291 RepID=UPI00120A9E03|nr:gamma-glutamylcyclotransferase family protein [Reyranella sp.]MDP2332158.1 gamma-glutamylcyclotransferase family protein [Reyranella sp.]TAJ41402.1 MAG: gamma-glutamylcyclotransferase [Reyranella sp.]
MLDQPNPLLHIVGEVIRPERGRHMVFTYDEAMDDGVVRARCPDPKFVCTARCTGRRIIFGPTGASVIHALGREVYGAVWEVDAAGLAGLDASMGAPGVKERRGAFVRTSEGRLLVTDIYALTNPELGEPDPALVLRIAELGGRLGFPIGYKEQIRGWLGASIH